MIKQTTIIYSIWSLNFTVASVFYIFKYNANNFYVYILLSIIYLLNYISGYSIIRDLSMRVNWKIKNNFIINSK